MKYLTDEPRYSPKYIEAVKTLDARMKLVQSQQKYAKDLRDKARKAVEGRK